MVSNCEAIVHILADKFNEINNVIAIAVDENHIDVKINSHIHDLCKLRIYVWCNAITMYTVDAQYWSDINYDEFNDADEFVGLVFCKIFYGR